MNLNPVMGVTYLLGWAAAVVAVVYRALQALDIQAAKNLPVTPRGVLFFSAFLFVATVATAAYQQAQVSPAGTARSTSA